MFTAPNEIQAVLSVFSSLFSSLVWDNAMVLILLIPAGAPVIIGVDETIERRKGKSRADGRFIFNLDRLP
jgi:hypothetical protein